MVYCYSGLNGLRHSLCKSEFVCDNLEGQDGGWVVGRLRKEGTHKYLQPIHDVEWQKPTPCKTIILQLK